MKFLFEILLALFIQFALIAMVVFSALYLPKPVGAGAIIAVICIWIIQLIAAVISLLSFLENLLTTAK